MHLFERFKLPTIFGLGIILAGIIAGTVLVLNSSDFTPAATADVTPKNVTITNISDSQASISWQTNTPAASFLTFGVKNPTEQTVLDERDKTSPSPHFFHSVILKNLLPKTEYQFKITTARNRSEIFRFKTASPSTIQNSFGPVIGSVVDKDGPLSEGLAYLSISNTIIQSSLVKSLGNFLIPLTQIRKSDLSDILPLENGVVAKLTIIGKTAQSQVLFKLNEKTTSLPTIKLGQDLDLTSEEIQFKEVTPSASDLEKFDINEDGKINAADHGIVLTNFGKNPKEKRADFNLDKVVDQKDLNLLYKRMGELGIPLPSTSP